MGVFVVLNDRSPYPTVNRRKSAHRRLKFGMSILCWQLQKQTLDELSGVAELWSFPLPGLWRSGKPLSSVSERSERLHNVKMIDNEHLLAKSPYRYHGNSLPLSRKFPTAITEKSLPLSRKFPTAITELMEA